MKNIRSRDVLIFIFVIIVTAFVAVSAIAKSDNSSKSKSESKSNSSKELKNYEKPNASKSNSQIHTEKITGVVKNLDKVANREETQAEKKINNPADKGNEVNEKNKIRESITEVADAEEVAVEDVAEAIKVAENQNKFKKFLIGTDYKNLGQLRSSLVHNRNQIKKLTKTVGAVEEGNQTAIQEQLTVLMQERERVKAVITENEGGFSLLGWMFRLFNGEENQIDEEEEEQLVEEVEEALEIADETEGETVTDSETATE